MVLGDQGSQRCGFQAMSNVERYPSFITIIAASANVTQFSWIKVNIIQLRKNGNWRVVVVMKNNYCGYKNACMSKLMVAVK